MDDDAVEEQIGPWERQPGETMKTYGFFAAYRDLGSANRSVRKDARITGKTESWLYKLSAQNCWGARASAWDLHLDQHAREKGEEARKEMAERHAHVSRGIVIAVTQRVYGAPEEGVQRLDPNTLNAGDLARLLQVAANLERLSRGAPTERVEPSGTAGPQVAPQLAVVLDDLSLAVRAEELAIDLARAKLAAEAPDRDRD